MNYIKLFDQYNTGLGSEPYSQSEEIKNLLQIDYPLFHKTPFIKNVSKILNQGIKRIPNKILHYLGFGGNPLDGISFTNSFKLCKSKWKGDITFIFDKNEIINQYGDNFRIIKEGGESEELLVGVNHIDKRLIKAVMFSDNIETKEIKQIKNQFNIITLQQTSDNKVILV